jgi:hypothetical protein
MKKEKNSRMFGKKKLRVKQALALSEIFMFVLSSFAFAFILGGMGVLSAGEVMGEDGEINIWIVGDKIKITETDGSYTIWQKSQSNTWNQVKKVNSQGFELNIDTRTSWTDKGMKMQISQNPSSVELVSNTQINLEISELKRQYPQAEVSGLKYNTDYPDGYYELKNPGGDVFRIPKEGVRVSDAKSPEPQKPSGAPAPPPTRPPAPETSEGGETAKQTSYTDFIKKNKDSLTETKKNSGVYKGTETGPDGKPITYYYSNGNNGELIKTTDKSYKVPVIGEVTPTTWWGHGLANLGEGVAWGLAVWGISAGIAAMLPDEKAKNWVTSIGRAVAAGVFAAKATAAVVSMYNKLKSPGGIGEGHQAGEIGGWGAGASIVVGLITAYLVFAYTYKKEKEKEQSIEFKCMAWQAPNGGASCGKCNDNPLMPCSEYRCKSLGQTCKLINAGTTSAKCIDGGRNDVTSPGIKPWQEILTKGYAYSNVRERPPGKTSGTSGMKITYNNGCLPAFSPFEFGIITTDTGGVSQPSQCKIDFDHTKTFDEMEYYMNDDNLYVNEHSQAMSLPGVDLVDKLISEANASLEIKNDGEYNFYIRCKDGNGNVNADEFTVSFCVDKTPDVTAPIIKATNPISSSAVLYQVDNVSTDVYVNEPSQCRWSRKDASYENMENQMKCSNNLWEMNAEFLYTCKTTLTGIKDKQENKFYFRCVDLSKQENKMSQSYEYSLFGSQPLNILKTSPNETISGATSTVTTTLSVLTDNGFKNGESTCYYSGNKDKGFIEMAETGRNSHSQSLDLTEGSYTYYFRCVDAGGNTASNSTQFRIFVDRYAPVVTRIYNFEGKLTINTDEESSCKYSTTSCNFDMNKEGIAMPYDNNKMHYAEWKTSQSYYIKCMDKDNNQPNPSECSAIIRPYRSE